MTPPGSGGPPLKLPPARAKKGRRKLGGPLLALSAAAIASVYTVGYLKTESSLDRLAGTQPTAGSAPAPSTQPPASAASSNNPTRTQPATPATPGAAAQGAVTAYRDGTYTGMGMSRHGGMQVTVVIRGGRIVSAAVSQCNTRYPCSDVDPLVRSVVSQQAPPVSHVSGATDSSRAYTTAVKAALAQAAAV